MIESNQNYSFEIKYGQSATLSIKIVYNSTYNSAVAYKYKWFKCDSNKSNPELKKTYITDFNIHNELNDTKDSYTTEKDNFGNHYYFVRIYIIDNNIESEFTDSPIMNVNVTQKELIIIPDSKTLVYSTDMVDPIFTFTVQGLVYSDGVSVIKGKLTTSDTNRSENCMYLINTGLSADNYCITYQIAYLFVLKSVSPTTDNFAIVTAQLAQLNPYSDPVTITVPEDKSTPTTISVVVYISPDTSINLVPQSNNQNSQPQISDVQVETQNLGATYMIANLITPSPTSVINSTPILFSLFYKALDDNFESVVSRLNPFILSFKIKDVNEIKLYKYLSGNNVQLIENLNYEVEKNGDIFLIKLFSNSYISIVPNDNKNTPIILFSLTNLIINKKISITNHSNINNPLRYSLYSSDDNIATIDVFGVITPISEGKFHIIVAERNTSNIIYYSYPIIVKSE